MILDATKIDYFEEVRNKIIKLLEQLQGNENIGAGAIDLGTVYLKAPELQPKRVK